MAKPKREKPAIRLFVTTDRANGERLGRIAVKATKEAGTIVSANTIHGRGMPAMLAALDSCRECRAGTCDGSVHVRRADKNLEGSLSSNCSAASAHDLQNSEIILEYPMLTPPTSVRKGQGDLFDVAPALIVADGPAAVKRGKPAGSNKRAYPEGFALTDEMRAYAVRNGIAADRVGDMFEHFSTHHRAKGSKFVDWTLAFYTWVRNDRQFGGANQKRTGKPSSTQDEPLPEGWT